MFSIPIQIVCFVDWEIVLSHCTQIRTLYACIIGNFSFRINEFTRVLFAFIYVSFTKHPCKSWQTVTRKRWVHLSTISTMFTTNAVTIINIVLTICSVITRIAITFICIDLINTITINARLWLTLIYLNMAIFTSITRLTSTVVIVDFISARCIILTWLVLLAFVNLNLTLRTIIASVGTITDFIVKFINTGSIVKAIFFFIAGFV